MATLSLQAHGVAPVTLAWERYADPALWSTWSPQIQRVDTEMRRLEAGATGTVRAGLLARPTLGIAFRVLAVDEAAREWAWEAWLGPVRMRLEHGVTAHLTGSSTWLRVHGPLPVIAGYAPVARIALGRLVAA
jgi:hypothetical protein